MKPRLDNEELGTSSAQEVKAEFAGLPVVEYSGTAAERFATPVAFFVSGSGRHVERGRIFSD